MMLTDTQRVVVEHIAEYVWVKKVKEPNLWKCL